MNNTTNSYCGLHYTHNEQTQLDSKARVAISNAFVYVLAEVLSVLFSRAATYCFSGIGKTHEPRCAKTCIRSAKLYHHVSSEARCVTVH